MTREIPFPHEMPEGYSRKHCLFGVSGKLVHSIEARADRPCVVVVFCGGTDGVSDSAVLDWIEESMWSIRNEIGS